MRLWHYKLLPYLPEDQFKGQLRELVAIVRAKRDKGTPNHILVNYVTLYPDYHLYNYFRLYQDAYVQRYGKETSSRIQHEMWMFGAGEGPLDEPVFPNHHDAGYLRVCMYNLYEKHQYASGKSALTDAEWQRLLYGYQTITGKEFVL